MIGSHTFNKIGMFLTKFAFSKQNWYFLQVGIFNIKLVFSTQNWYFLHKIGIFYLNWYFLYKLGITYKKKGISTQNYFQTYCLVNYQRIVHLPVPMLTITKNCIAIADVRTPA